MNNPATTKPQLPDSQVPMPQRIPVGRQMSAQATDISVEKQGETVTAIKIACQCGEKITIDCTYPETA